MDMFEFWEMDVQVGDSFKSGRYVVEKELGGGCFSTVWLTRDTHTNRNVALKVLDKPRHDTEADVDEINILQQIAKGDPEDQKYVVKLLDHFRHSVPNGEHVVCMVFEHLGDDLSTLIRDDLSTLFRNPKLSISMVKEICFHILVGLDYLHRLSIIHDDLKLENVVLPSKIGESKDLVSVDLKCKLVDFGKARWTNKKFPDDPQSGPYRCPELILKTDHSTPGDLWSFACICFELATGDVLFDFGQWNDEGHLAAMMGLLGKMPCKIASRGPFSLDCFNRYGNERHTLRLRIRRLKNVLMEKYAFSEQDAKDMADFLGRILDFDPDKRPTAAQCLQHPWITQR